MRPDRRVDLRIALLGSIALSVLVVCLRTNPATRFRMELALARVNDFLADDGDCQAHVSVVASLAFRARRDHPLEAGPDPRQEARGWTWIEQDGLIIATFYNGFAVHWDVYGYDSGELRLLEASGVVYG